MRKVLISAEGKVFAYVALDGAIVLLCDDQPRMQLFEALITQQSLDEILSNSGDNDACNFMVTWLTTTVRNTRRDISL